jgi:hypothetical protein
MNNEKCEVCSIIVLQRTYELIKDSYLWRSNFIPSVHDSIIIIGSRFCYFILLIRVLFINFWSMFVTLYLWFAFCL